MTTIATFGEDFPLTYFVPSLMASGVTQANETVSAQEYLAYAREDLKSEDNRALINAFGNAKRSIHKLVDDLIFQYGLSGHCRRLSFPQKLQTLSELEIVSPFVLSALNVDRNAVEHDYVAPSLKRTREAVDVAELLLLAMSGFRFGIPYEGFCCWRKDRRHVLLRLNPWQCTLTLHKYVRPNGARFRTVAGVRCYWQQVRDTEYRYYLEVSDTPWKSIPMTKAHKPTWGPILHEFVQLQKFKRFDVPFVTMTLDERFVDVFKGGPSAGRSISQLANAQGFEIPSS
ncbi:hypothetical protein [Streptomyces nigrescens]|uniref:hypothetical protein n=1 Tax=Streptomyces nigrescens TaxID=1920 RepID=UPI00224EA29E|nr:hypothetical protein [Streptomyces libani]MCX5449914.1 hypothetical protein [Streptomyces libani]